MADRLYTDICSTAIDIVKACAASQGFLSGANEISEKARQDYVSDIDIAAEQFLTQEISKRYPEHRVLGEETVEDGVALAGHCWLIDPLDGTQNFINNIPFFCISLALLKDGEPVVAIVYDILHDELFDAVKGHGFRVNGTPTIPSNDKAAITISSGTIDRVLDINPQGLADLRQIGRFRIFGSQALHLAYVAVGRIKAAISVEAKLWDDAAGALLVTEAGGFYGGFNGQPLDQFTKVSKTTGLCSLACPAALVDPLSSILGGYISD